jgi:putative chitinase
VRPVFLWVLGGAVVIYLLSRSKTVTSAAASVATKVSEAVSSGAKKLLTLNAIRKAMPNVSLTSATDYLTPLVEALDEAGINTPARISAFLAQLGHESADFKFMEENLNYSADALVKVFPKYFNATTAAQYARQPQKIASKVYGGRMGNGPEATGDGWKYRGRGPIQLTGKDNYKAFTEAVGKKYGVDFVANPDLLAQPKWGFKAAAWYWTTRNLNALADQGNFDQITYRINGGYKGKEDRDKRFLAAKAALAESATA